MKLQFIVTYCLFSVVSVFGDTELVYPWVTNNSLFKSKIIIVNPSDQTITVGLSAQRADGSNEKVSREITAYGQWVESTETLFETLGEGPGYAVTLTSLGDGVQGGMVVSGTGSSSGDSPAQANPMSSSLGSMVVLFSYLPIPNDPVAASAPVVVNVGASTAEVHFYGYQDGNRFESDTVVNLQPGMPYAALTGDLFPDLVGDIYVVASADQMLLGMAFLFNGLREPSMSEALPITSVPLGNESNSFTYSFSQDVWAGIIQNNCAVSGCHGNGSSQFGLNMDLPNMYNNTVNVLAAQDSGRFRINPGNAEESFLYRKVDPSLSQAGSPMPLNRTPLNSSQLEVLRTWINEGAPNN